MERSQLDEPDDFVTITDPAEDRYASLRLINWWKQERIQEARVMVVGAGALGNEVLKNLALLGIGHIYIVDFDTIEMSNLTRSLLYHATDRGLPKAQIAAERVRRLNPDSQVVAFHGDISKDVGPGFYRRMDLVIGCLDNRAARLAVNSACLNMNIPWIDGALDALNGLIRVFLPSSGPCYECTMQKQDYALLDLRYSCIPGEARQVVSGRQPTMPTTAALIAAMQVQEAVKLLHQQPVEGGKAIYYSWQALTLSDHIYTRREDCPAHIQYGSVISLAYRRDQLNLKQLGEVLRATFQGKILLFLPSVIITTLYCPVCDSKEEIYRPHHLLEVVQMTCPRCTTDRVPDATSMLSVEEMQRDIPLEQLEIPILHIFPVRTADGWRYCELSGDEQLLLTDS